MQAIESWNVSTVLAVALMLVAAAMLVLGLSMARRLRGQDRSRQVVDQALATREGAPGRRPKRRRRPKGRRGGWRRPRARPIRSASA